MRPGHWLGYCFQFPSVLWHCCATGRACNTENISATYPHKLSFGRSGGRKPRGETSYPRFVEADSVQRSQSYTATSHPLFLRKTVSLW